MCRGPRRETGCKGALSAGEGGVRGVFLGSASGFWYLETISCRSGGRWPPVSNIARPTENKEKDKYKGEDWNARVEATTLI